MWMYLHTYMYECVWVFPLACIHSLKVLQSVLKWLPPKTSLWEFDELSLEYFALHTQTHTCIHTRTYALIQRACVWVLVSSGLGPGPGLAWVSFPLCLPTLALRLLCQSWSFCFMTSSGEMCLQLLLLPASSTSLPLTWIWISRNLTSQLGWHRICVRVHVCVWVQILFFFLCNVRNFLLFIVRLGPLCAARII